MNIPAEAEVVIVGGGVIGTSIAYHLTKAGVKGVVLLEQNKLGGGTTWHAAGLVGRLRTSNSLTKINKYSAELYASLQKETGHNVGWKQTGSLIVGKSESRMTQLYRTAAMAELFGVQVDIISPEVCFEKWPLLRIDDLLGGAWLPHDGKVLPGELPLALAKGAQSRGAAILEGIRVTGLERTNNRVSAVQTNQGTIRARQVVLCGGMWTRQLGLDCGVPIPLYPVEHHYIVSEEIPGAFDELPVGRDPDLCLYFRGEGNAVMLGAFQKYTKPWQVDKIPDDFSFKLLEPDWEKYQEPLAAGKWRIPALSDCKFAKFVNGPESFTPDNNFIMGETAEIQGLWVAAGFNSVGIASAGGAGKYLAEWMIDGQPSIDLWSVDVRRFDHASNNLRFLKERVTEVLGLHYQTAWPNREMESARGLKRSPLHEHLSAAGAWFGNKSGWERPNWFSADGAKPEIEYSFGKQNWFENHRCEHLAARETVAIFDQSSFGKILIQGKDAVQLLQRVCGNNVDVPIGKTIYTGMFNKRGGFESDCTLLRTRADQFVLITGTSQPKRDMDYIQRNKFDSEQVELAEVSAQYVVLGLMGPRSRAVLQKLTDADLENSAFPFGTFRDIGVGYATVRAVRITYVGELGWELHVPVHQALQVYNHIMEAGADDGIANAGHYAINSLRLEKGYRAWGAELSPDDSPLEAGLGFAIDWTKEFIGKEELLKQKEKPLNRKLFTFVLQDPEQVLWGSEPIYLDGQPVGYTTSGAYGHSVGGAVGMGYIKGDFDWKQIASRKVEIGVNGKRMAAAAYLKPPYDPERKRILV